MHSLPLPLPPPDTLDLRRNHLEDLPPLQHIPHKGLMLQYNLLHSIHTNYLPQHLEWLNVKENRLWHDGWVGRPLMHLHTLILDGNYVSDYPTLAAMAPSLRHISLSFMTTSANFEHLRRVPLESLVVEDARVPLQKVEGLPSTLRHLHIVGCEVRLVQSRLPDSLLTCNLSYNHLASGGVPLRWGSYLQELNLSYNRIQMLPRSLPATLRVLQLQHNRIQHFPMGLPESLEVLNLSCNRIREMPATFRRDKPLVLCSLEGNELVCTSPDVPWAKVLLTNNNWNTIVHQQKAHQIQGFWRLFRLRKTLRNIYRCSKLRHELLEISMHPSRAHQFENISPEWFTGSGHNRKDRRWG